MPEPTDTPDVRTRAREALSDREYARACGVEPSGDRAYRLLPELLAHADALAEEVERLREMVGRCTGCNEICDGRCGTW